MTGKMFWKIWVLALIYWALTVCLALTNFFNTSSHILFRVALQGRYIIISIVQPRKLWLRKGEPLPRVVTTTVCRTRNGTQIVLSPCFQVLPRAFLYCWPGGKGAQNSTRGRWISVFTQRLTQMLSNYVCVFIEWTNDLVSLMLAFIFLAGDL